MKKYIYKLCSLIFLLTVILYSSGISSAYSYSKEIDIISKLDSTTQPPGGNVSLSCSLISSNTKQISSFMMYIYFDTSILSYSKLSLSNNLKSGNVHTSEHDGCITIIYLEDESYLSITADKEKSIFDITFKVNNDISVPTNAIINTSCPSIIDTNFKSINVQDPENLKLLIEYPEEIDASLESLVPSIGELTPSFNPNITQYSMEVASNINSITFDTVPKNKQSTVTVNRKTLQSYGTTTDFKITSSSTDGNTIVYIVSIYRRTKSEDDVSSSSSKDVSDSSNPSSKVISSKSTSSKSTSSVSASSSIKLTTSSIKASTTSSTKSSSKYSLSSNNAAFKLNENDQSYDNFTSSEIFSPKSITLGNNTPKIFAVIFIVFLIILAFIIIFYKKKDTYKITKDENADDKSENQKE